MTIEEKRAAIESYCHVNQKGSCLDENGDPKCPLYHLEDASCYTACTYDQINAHYSILFDGESSEKPVSADSFDVVNRAEHYNRGGIECIKAIEASMTPEEYTGFLKGQVIKYVWRYRHKGKPVEDLEKARYYLDDLIRVSKEAVENA